MELTKPFAGSFKGKKNAQPSTGKSLNGKISILEYLRFPFMFLYFFSFTLMILKNVSLPMQSYLQIILLCFLLCMTLKHLQMISIKIRKQLIAGLFNGKLTLIQILLNKLKKSFLVAKQKKYMILRQCLIIPVVLSHHPKNIWVLYLTLS